MEECEGARARSVIMSLAVVGAVGCLGRSGRSQSKTKTVEDTLDKRNTLPFLKRYLNQRTSGPHSTNILLELVGLGEACYMTNDERTPLLCSDYDAEDQLIDLKLPTDSRNYRICCR
ncbi:hypothetical protein O181_063320 [Austropuccinia psidii MF-1]|uniref:Uncharacterized protein n=1 Tax=Austropuccinia psidii MF-1 TaxID=1389203 RepID=A0A9Q3EIL6_9BASI|nr:hypothetical protein [Austropuccinia psidii MF-1]